MGSRRAITVWASFCVEHFITIDVQGRPRYAKHAIVPAVCAILFAIAGADSTAQPAGAYIGGYRLIASSSPRVSSG